MTKGIKDIESLKKEIESFKKIIKEKMPKQN